MKRESIEPANSTLVLNLFGGPGIGKTYAASALCEYFIRAGHESRVALEAAKPYYVRGDKVTQGNQVYITAKQYREIVECGLCEDLVITDSPLLLGILYPDKMSTEAWRQHVWEMHHSFHNLNVMLVRDLKLGYREVARKQSAPEALELDQRVIELLESRNEPYMTIQAGPKGYFEVLKAYEKLRREQCSGQKGT